MSVGRTLDLLSTHSVNFDFHDFIYRGILCNDQIRVKSKYFAHWYKINTTLSGLHIIYILRKNVFLKWLKTYVTQFSFNRWTISFWNYIDSNLVKLKMANTYLIPSYLNHYCSIYFVFVFIYVKYTWQREKLLPLPHAYKLLLKHSFVSVSEPSQHILLLGSHCRWRVSTPVHVDEQLDQAVHSNHAPYLLT